MSLIEVKLSIIVETIPWFLWNEFKHFQQSNQFLIKMIYDLWFISLFSINL